MSTSLEPAELIQARFQLRFSAQTSTGFALDLDTEFPGRGVTAIFGQSGSGKTTLLRCVAGLERATDGRLVVKGEVWQDEQGFRPTHKRPLGYVFQESSLFPHLTAQGNLDYAIKRSGYPHDEDLYQRVLSIMGIEPVLERYPSQLSGGERQRVAIARALLIRPRLLLMDEPLASLDAARKQEILPYLEKLHASFDLPILYVSHSVDEVARLADQVLVLDEGRLIDQGPVSEVLSHLDRSLGMGEDAGVVLQGRVTERDNRWHLARVAFDRGELWIGDGGDPVGQPLRLRILARDISLAHSPHADTSVLNQLPVEVEDIADDHNPAMAWVRLKAGSERLIARVTRRSVAHLALAPGQRIWAYIKSVAIVR
ncbi:molybdenum ABC transporter ATP-binding protein [Saccharospirillum salsuginis]|uniref:Molybdenum import ATP-binding protein ModC n=1 Tax=Saccharospirillum salsuginis TaxID=418750 RepID=A0A918K5Z1_9GAMM|nr:molybdenum ABC transporter ATP-binding protein [Saccharospirillum salsuginis]GGX48860.1 molybdenum import ATP-binding protein ModC [Saccharospirillum salsuginis]